MPYIKIVDRNRETRQHPKKAGDLNWILSEVCKIYLLENGTSYQTINDVVGALEGCKLEFYRRIVAPYEDIKIKENGDVYVV